MFEVDVILPFHLDNKFLAESVESIYSSKGVQVNLILIDDRKSPELLSVNSRRFRVLKSDGNGYATAINLARNHLSSPYVALMNSDDLVHPNRLVRQINQLEQCEASISACGMQKFKGKRKAISRFGSLDIDGALDRRVLLLGAYAADATWCAKTDWWTKNVEFIHQPMSDWATAMKISHKNKIFFIREKLYFYRQHSNQTTRKKAFPHNGTDAIYRMWTQLANDTGTISLTENEFTWVAAPRSNRKLSKFEFNNVVNWLFQFDDSTNSKFNNLILRRLLLLKLSAPMIWGLPKFSSSAIQGALSLSEEYLGTLKRIRFAANR